MAGVDSGEVPKRRSSESRRVFMVREFRTNRHRLQAEEEKSMRNQTFENSRGSVSIPNLEKYPYRTQSGKQREGRSCPQTWRLRAAFRKSPASMSHISVSPWLNVRNDGDGANLRLDLGPVNLENSKWARC